MKNKQNYLKELRDSIFFAQYPAQKPECNNTVLTAFEPGFQLHSAEPAAMWNKISAAFRNLVDDSREKSESDTDLPDFTDLKIRFCTLDVVEGHQNNGCFPLEIHQLKRVLPEEAENAFGPGGPIYKSEEFVRQLFSTDWRFINTVCSDMILVDRIAFRTSNLRKLREMMKMRFEGWHLESFMTTRLCFDSILSSMEMVLRITYRESGYTENIGPVRIFLQKFNNDWFVVRISGLFETFEAR